MSEAPLSQAVHSGHGADDRVARWRCLVGELDVPDSAAMERLGERVASVLQAGDVVLLTGELGAGKTTLTRGIGRALGVRGTVTSPTFVLARTHRRAVGEVPLVHVDAYRLRSAAELEDLDLDVEHAITVVEWGEGKAAGLADLFLAIRILRPLGGAPSTGTAVEPRGSLTDEPEAPGDEEAPRHVVVRMVDAAEVAASPIAV